MQFSNKRRSGRTLGGLLAKLGEAIANPGVPVYYQDHEVNTYDALRNYHLPFLMEIIKALNLDIKATVTTNIRAKIPEKRPVLKIVSTYVVPSNAVDFIKRID